MLRKELVYSGQFKYILFQAFKTSVPYQHFEIEIFDRSVCISSEAALSFLITTQTISMQKFYILVLYEKQRHTPKHIFRTSPKSDKKFPGIITSFVQNVTKKCNYLVEFDIYQYVYVVSL